MIFSVKRYANSLTEICKERDIDVAFREELIEVNAGTNEAVFRNVNNPIETKTLKVRLLFSFFYLMFFHLNN